MGTDQEKLGAAERAPRADPLPALRRGRDDPCWRSSPSARASTCSTRTQLAGAIPLLVIGVYVLSVVGFYFSVGLAAAADMIFRGQEATVADGLAVARSRFSQICGWAAISTAISLVMGAAREPGRDRRPDRRPPGRHGLGAGHLPGGAGDRDRGHRPVRDAEALGLDLPRALGPADHRQHRDRRRDRPARRAAGGAR